ncbi:MAG: PilZ domain-containing protein [Myxococcota bacterium]
MPSKLWPEEERRRGPRVAPKGLFKVEMATRVLPGTQPLTVRDVSVFGFGLTAPQPLPVTFGERVYLLVDFSGDTPLSGSLIQANIRRRSPDRDGWFVGVEFDDLRASPWVQLACWIDRQASPRAHRAVEESRLVLPVG